MEPQTFKAKASLSQEEEELFTLLLEEEEISLLYTRTIESTQEVKIPLLSFSQQRLWFLNQLELNSSTYNLPKAYSLTGILNITALEQSLNQILHRHEILRTTFPLVDGQPSQIIAPYKILTLPIIDLKDHPQTEREVIAQQIVTQEAHRPFDLAQETLFRVKLLRLTEVEHMLLLNIHHIVFDGWSFDVFFREIAALYQAFSTNQLSPLSQLPIQYADFAHWQHQWLQGEVLESQLNYWKQQLGGSLSTLKLPTDYPRLPVQTYPGAYQFLELSLDLTKALKALSQQEGVTLFMTLLAVFQTLLFRYSGQEDIIIGTPIAGRNQVETDGLIGFFVNSLAIRINLSGNPTFCQLLNQVREVTLGAYDHQDLPLEKLIEELNPERDPSRSPLFQVMFAFQNTPSQSWELPGLTITPLEIHSGTSKFDLTLDLRETSDGIKGGIEYNTDLFEAATITRMLGHFQILLEGIVANPKQHLSDLPFLTAAEQHRLLVEWNNTQSNYPNNSCIHQLFEAQVERTPNAIAVVFKDKQLTYQQLNRRANQLAHHLQKLGVKPEVLVGICVERSLEMLVGLLGILKAGGAYVPLDPDYPSERLAFMLEDTQVPVLLTQKSLVEKLPANPAHIVCLDTDWDKFFNCQSENNPICNTTADNLAYVMYTSGSTGKPKGVCVVHRGVVRLVKSINYAKLGSEETFLQLASISFDASTFEIWGSLLNGAQLAIFPPHTLSLEELGQAIRRYQVTTLWLTAGLFHLMVDERLEDLKPLCQLLTGGDVLSVPHVQKFLQKVGNCQLINGYGPTENTTFTCYYRITEPSQLGNSVPIGRPISNTQIYILDRHLNPVPIGIPGELHIGGNGLARGYLNRPKLTQEKFISNPFQRSRGAKEDSFSNLEWLYKTGDLARCLPDGSIEFLGRIDNQVKIRGFRIELGEIEATILQHTNVQQTVVIAREDISENKRLVAYIVLNRELKLTTDELRRFLKQKLPDYMMPGAFVFLKNLPLTPNGKVDRCALPAPALTRLEPEEAFVAPSNELELQLTKIWERVLNIQPIGVKDNFFTLGGHSLTAVDLLAKIGKVLEIKLPLATLFQAPTIKQIVEHLQNYGYFSGCPALIPIQPKGNKPSLFLCEGASIYKTLTLHLGLEQPVYGLIIEAESAKTNDFHCLEDLAAYYIEKMQTLQPQGPYFLGGISWGGLVAFEIAQQLTKQGQKVALLAFFDTIKPGAVKILPIRKRIVYHVKQILQGGISYVLKKLARKNKQNNNRIKKILGRLTRKDDLLVAKELEHLANREAYYQLVRNYAPQLYSGSITIFASSNREGRETFEVEPGLGWINLAEGGLEIYEIPGTHLGILQEPNVQILAEKLMIAIDNALELVYKKI